MAVRQRIILFKYVQNRGIVTYFVRYIRSEMYYKKSDWGGGSKNPGPCTVINCSKIFCSHAIYYA